MRVQCLEDDPPDLLPNILWGQLWDFGFLDRRNSSDEVDFVALPDLGLLDKLVTEIEDYGGDGCQSSSAEHRWAA